MRDKINKLVKRHGPALATFAGAVGALVLNLDDGIAAATAVDADTVAGIIAAAGAVLTAYVHGATAP
ncbi:MAG: hypothetical protein OXE50_02250 [Chloroflexi bacterium]|nr:hypothetical protein [Chloroflexota bacterium]